MIDPGKEASRYPEPLLSAETGGTIVMTMSDRRPTRGPQGPRRSGSGGDCPHSSGSQPMACLLTDVMNLAGEIDD